MEGVRDGHGSFLRLWDVVWLFDCMSSFTDFLTGGSIAVGRFSDWACQD